MAYKAVGNTIVEWDDNAPFIFTLVEKSGPENARVMCSETINLTPLRASCEDAFLLHLKESLIESRNRLSLTTVKSQAKEFVGLFGKMTALDVFDTKVSFVDESFLLSLGAVLDQIPNRYSSALANLFDAAPSSPLFAKGLQKSDFPVRTRKKGWHGGKIDSILGKALSQATVAHILDQCDSAYATGEMNIELYSFAHLAFAVYCRPNSYRQIRIKDFNFDPKTKQYTIQIVTSKTGEHFPSKTIFSINEPLGILLTKQRQHVISTYGHLVEPEELDKLALFPARGLSMDKSRWMSDHANQTWGMYEDGERFATGYSKKITKVIGAKSSTLSANALRHTVGTLLAQTGASSKTIQAVLRHADDQTCKAYIDIAFHGLIGELSKTMRPAFESHLPGLLSFRSKADPIAEEQRIRSEDLDTGQIEDTGECGKSMACERAPIVCYSCFRFRPCWDADHSINLKGAQREIDDMAKRGKPFEHMVNRARNAANRIILIMNAADRYRDSMKPEIQR